MWCTNHEPFYRTFSKHLNSLCLCQTDKQTQILTGWTWRKINKGRANKWMNEWMKKLTCQLGKTNRKWCSLKEIIKFAHCRRRRRRCNESAIKCQSARWLSGNHLLDVENAVVGVGVQCHDVTIRSRRPSIPARIERIPVARHGSVVDQFVEPFQVGTLVWFCSTILATIRAQITGRWLNTCHLSLH